MSKTRRSKSFSTRDKLLQDDKFRRRVIESGPAFPKFPQRNCNGMKIGERERIFPADRGRQFNPHSNVEACAAPVGPPAVYSISQKIAGALRR